MFIVCGSGKKKKNYYYNGVLNTCTALNSKPDMLWLLELPMYDLERSLYLTVLSSNGGRFKLDCVHIPHETIGVCEDDFNQKRFWML